MLKKVLLVLALALVVVLAVTACTTDGGNTGNDAFDDDSLEPLPGETLPGDEGLEPFPGDEGMEPLPGEEMP